MRLELLLTVYSTVLAAELVGDRTLYALGALGTRVGLAPALAGAAVAFMLKMGAAVLLGRLVAGLPATTMAAVSAITFFAMAAAVWFKRPASPAAEPAPHWRSAAAMSFAAIFFPEWGDAGQITAALLSAQSREPQVVWLGGTLALLTKAALALTLGVGLRRWVSQRIVRGGTVTLCVIMGLLAAFQIEL